MRLRIKKEKIMATIHFILQGKGGVGKSLVASILYQGIVALGHEVMAYDSDPVNATLSGFNEFEVQRLELLKADGNIDTRKFDELLEDLAIAPDNTHVIVDNGASSFIALGSYMQENSILDILQGELGHKVYFHTIITGGQSIKDTVDGFVRLVRTFPQSSLIVWLNPFFGEINVDGKSFIDFKCFIDHGHKVHSIIELPLGDRNLIGKDLETLFAKKQSFSLGISGSNHIMVRHRLKKYWENIVSQIEQANIC